MLKDLAINFVSGLIPDVLGVLTPDIKELVESGVRSWWERAKQTDNPWDNYAVSLIAGVLGLKLQG